MKNANVFVDVDLTLVDANGRLLPGATEGLTKLRDKGCHLFLWSTNGADYARKIASLYGLTQMFEGFSPKPDIIIDDMPGTALNPLVFDVNAETSWLVLTDKIIRKHIDEPVRVKRTDYTITSLVPESSAFGSNRESR